MRTNLLAFVAVLAFATVAPCGTVITTNVPAETAIVNINAQQDGAATYDGSQDNWYHPFFTGGATALLQHTIQPGTYTFRLTNPTLAASEFPALTSAQLSQVFTAWTYNSPWITDYYVFNSAGATNYSIPQIFAGAIRPAGLNGGTGSATDAFNYAMANDYDDIIVKQPGGRITGIRVREYTFTAADTLTFAIPDNYLPDNNGGVSVVISPAGNPPGDYNDNNVVDAADYILWRKNNNTATTLPNDTTSGTVNNGDYTVWRSHFGQTAVSGAGNGSLSNAAVPEPSNLVLLMFAAAVWCLRRDWAA